MTWQAEALCKGEDPTLWFPISDHPHQQTRAAKRICYSCTVRVECLSYAVQAGEPDGIWGGLTVRERRSIRTTRTSANA